MSVSTSVTLPSSPATGTLEYVPLGGDGFTAPFAMYNIRGMTVTGDASAGIATLTINMDDRYTALVGYCMGQIEGAGGNRHVRMNMGGGRTAGAKVDELVVVNSSQTQSIILTWVPPPLVLPGGRTSVSLIQAAFLNVDTDIFSLDCAIYLFNIRARELAAIGPLNWARGSGSTT